MDRVNEGFENIASMLLEMQRRMQQMVAENRQLQEELAALRRGAGIMVVIEGRAYPLLTSAIPAAEPVHLPFYSGDP
jgi:regulator of replication initiation timing